MGRFRTPIYIVDDREIHGTLFEQMNGAMSWFRDRLETEFVITGQPEREVRWEYPLEAIREALINALCHRDYSSLAHSQIRLYDNYLEIRNAGSLPPPLTTEALFHEHDSMPRNRKIAEAFYYAGLIERWGSGMLRMIEVLKTAELPPPQFFTEAGHFRVCFYKEFKTDFFLKMRISERQLKAIAYINEHGSVSNTEYQTITGVSKRTASRELADLKQKGIITTEASGRATIYKLKGKQSGHNRAKLRQEFLRMSYKLI